MTMWNIKKPKRHYLCPACYIVIAKASYNQMEKNEGRTTTCKNCGARARITKVALSDTNYWFELRSV